MTTDRFGNKLALSLPYARGSILGSTEDDFLKLRRAWAVMHERRNAGGGNALFNFSGLEHGFPVEPVDVPLVDDQLAPSEYFDRVVALGLDHLGGEPDRHDVAVFNRLTGATLAVHLTLVERGDTVVGVSASYSHPSVLRAAAHAGATFVDTVGIAQFKPAIERADRVSLVVLTRLAVTYEMLPLDEQREIVRLAHRKGAKVYIDDAGGARVGPALFQQPRTLELGADLGATGLDKYGTTGPRLGLLGGDRALVSRARALGNEFGLEARPLFHPAIVRSLERYDASRVRELVKCTHEVKRALKERFGDHLSETPTIAQLRGEDILELAMERAGLQEPVIVPYEAAAALAMLMLRDYGIFSIHFIGLPPGTSAILFKFIPPETLQRFGGAAQLAEAVDRSVSKLAEIIGDKKALRELILAS